MSQKPSTATQNRVNNNLGILFSGGSNRRMVLLLDRKRFLALAHKNLGDALSDKGRDAVLGIVTLRREDDTYLAEVTEGDATGYNYILLQLASAASDADGVASVKWGRQMHSSRTWGPFQGLRRRGFQSRSKFQEITGLSNERMNQFVELLWRTASFGFGAEPDAEASDALE